MPALACVVLAALIFTPLVPDTRAKTFLMVIVAPLLCAFAVNHAAGFPHAIKNLLTLRVLRWFGTYSFSIYLWQEPWYFYAIGTAVPTPVCLGLALGCAVISFRYVEDPLRVHLNANWEARVRRRSVVAAAPVG